MDSSKPHLAMAAPLELGFCVADLERGLRFWRDALGLAFVSEIRTTDESAIGSGFARSGYRVVRLQLPTGERVKLFEPDRFDRSGAPPRDVPLGRVGFAFLTLIVTNLTATLGSLEAQGYPPRRARFELRPGVHVALVDDPDGNVVELVEYDDIAVYRADLAHEGSGRG